jgi:hypothetical protein
MVLYKYLRKNVIDIFVECYVVSFLLLCGEMTIVTAGDAIEVCKFTSTSYF